MTKKSPQKNTIHGMRTVDPRTLPWIPIAKGVTIKTLVHDKKKNQVLSIFKFKKGTYLTPHKHASLEWMYVLEGVYQDEFSTLPKGRLKINHKGSVHTSRSSRGCTLLVLWNGKHIPYEIS